MRSYLDDEFLNRVKRSYASSLEGFAADGEIWPMIDIKRLDIHNALLEDSNEKIRNIFRNPVSTDLFFGVDNLAVSVERIWASQSNVNLAIAQEAELLIYELSYALGAIRWVPDVCEHITNFRNGPSAEPRPSVGEILDRMVAKIGFSVEFPTPFPGERGVATPRGMASARAIAAIYQAHRISQELYGTPQGLVLEIGPGMGRTAYYATRAGIRNYTTIDLPMGIVAQACFLGATLGPDSIWMTGDMEEPRGRIRLLPSSYLDRLDQKFDIVLNVDSLTEMGSATIAAYAKWIATHAGIFLSINHEANAVTVPQIASEYFEDAVYFRFPYWLRQGYAEEMFKISSIS